MIKKEVVGGSLSTTFPKIAPHKTVSDYLKSREYLHHAPLRAYEWDKPRPDPELHLTATRRIYESTEEMLADKREVYKKMRLNLEEQWKELREKEEEFRGSFEKLSAFVTSNKDKRERAKRRWKEDVKMRLRRVEEIEKLQGQISSISETKTEMDTQIGKLVFYEKFLNSVLENGDYNCENIDDLINRFESLLKTRHQLGVRQATFLEELEQARNKIDKINEDNRLYILGLHNILDTLNSRYRTAINNAMHWENVVFQIKDNLFAKFQEINEVKQACKNICSLMNKRKGEAALKMSEEDFEKQLAYIKKTLQELKVVTEEARSMSKKSFSSMKGQTSKMS